MPLHPCKNALTSGVVFAIVATMSNTVGAQPLSQDVADARQETQVWKAYALNPHLSADHLEVSVLNGKATLSGEVETAANKTLAKAIALSVKGILAVDNRIVVQTKLIEVDSQVRAGAEQSGSDSWISDPGPSALLHTNATSTPLTPLERGAVSKPGDKPANRAKFPTEQERPQPSPELKRLNPDAFRF
ncbi:BON domain-containing protein [Pseudomonas sp. SA3-5]|uniref:BON domain-containing protein n=1 Tax=Pseudomonas aestuarii TaxID=3018340 RepID=A0ABT4XJ97_9PSED|nr:BON domain-containing protein [Pseudomonas aestuarii]MDA7088298.1 BON domain-containing protein [Pseudomonas aestuarii]